MRHISASALHVLWLSTLGISACRLLAGIEQPLPIDSLLDGSPDALLDGALDAGQDARFDVGVETGTDGGCVQCGSECVFTQTDVRHCGGCDSSCAVALPSTATCALGRCVATLATIPGTVSRPVVAGGFVYFTNTSNNTVGRVSTSGGNPNTIVTTDAGTVIATDGPSVYWFAGSRIWAASSDGTSPMALSPATVLQAPAGTAVDAISLYFGTGSSLKALDIHGGDPVTLTTAEGAIADVASDATSFYFTDMGSGVGGNVSSVPRAGGTPVKLATGQTNPTSIAVSATDVYWTTGQIVNKAPIGSSGSFTQFANGIDLIAIAGDDLYGRSISTGLVKVPLAGGTPVVIGPLTATPDVIDGTSVYWTEPSNGKVMRLWPR